MRVPRTFIPAEIQNRRSVRRDASQSPPMRCCWWISGERFVAASSRHKHAEVDKEQRDPASDPAALCRRMSGISAFNRAARRRRWLKLSILASAAMAAAAVIRPATIGMPVATIAVPVAMIGTATAIRTIGPVISASATLVSAAHFVGLGSG
jgi:hypothetical protein